VVQVSPKAVVPSSPLVGKAHVAYGDTMVRAGGSVWVKTDDGLWTTAFDDNMLFHLHR